MKIWLKYLLGCALGIIMSLILQSSDTAAIGVVQYLSDFSLRAGKFALMPLLFFTITVAVFELREDKLLLKIATYTSGISLLTTIGMILIGLITVLVFQPQRIPISVEEVSQTFSLDITQNILKLVPESNFESFLDGAYLLPLYAFAGFAGAGCASDRVAAKPVLTLFDSLSKVSYSVISFFIDMLAIGLIAVACSWMFSFPAIWKSEPLKHLIILVAVDAIAIIFIIYPMVLRFVFHERHPYRVLYACVASILTAFFSGDYNLTLGVSLRHARESMGLNSKISSVCLPVFSTFARGGAAMVLTISFVMILKSYSDMGITHDIPWILGISFILSYFMGGLPIGAPLVALATMCSLYGRGFETGYLIIKPAAFFLCSAAAAIDAVTSLIGTYYIASREKLVQHRELRFYI